MPWIDLIALVTSVVALGLSGWSVKYARDSARSSARSAAAGERQAAAAEASVPPPPRAVAWAVRKGGDLGYVLCNVGTETATGVQRILTGQQDDGSIKFNAGDGRVLSGGEVSFQVFYRWAAGRGPRELLLVWDGQSEPVAVPIPV